MHVELCRLYPGEHAVQVIELVHALQGAGQTI